MEQGPGPFKGGIRVTPGFCRLEVLGMCDHKIKLSLVTAWKRKVPSMLNAMLLVKQLVLQDQALKQTQ